MAYKALNDKLSHLENIIKDMKDGAVVAFSGGVDSTFLLKVCYDVLGAGKVLAVTSASETIPERELNKAKNLCEKIGSKHKIIYTNELQVDGFRKNPKDRCFYCKNELFDNLWQIAKENNLSNVLDGSNYDDMGDYRPGMKAAKKHGVKSPLQEAKLTKDDIRELSKTLDLPTWNKPAMACLSSRFPYGEEITKDKITSVEKAEDLLESLGYKQFRVRHHDSIARIEILPSEFGKILEDKDKITKSLKELGFKFVTLDLEGFRSGSMN